MVAALGAGYAQQVQFHGDAQSQPGCNYVAQIRSPSGSARDHYVVAPLASALTLPQEVTQESTDEPMQEQMDALQALQLLDEDIKKEYAPTIACLSSAIKALAQTGYSREDLESFQVDTIVMIPRWALTDLLFEVECTPHIDLHTVLFWTQEAQSIYTALRQTVDNLLRPPHFTALDLQTILRRRLISKQAPWTAHEIRFVSDAQLTCIIDNIDALAMPLLSKPEQAHSYRSLCYQKVLQEAYANALAQLPEDRAESSHAATTPCCIIC